MSRHMKSQHGFSTVLLVVLILVVVVVGFAGWKIASTDKNRTAKPETANLTASSTYTDTAKRFTFRYPSDWKISLHENTGRDYADEEAVPPPIDWTKVSRPLIVKPASGHPGNTVMVTPGCSTISTDGQSAGIIENLKSRNDKFHTQKDLTIHGYKAFYDKTDFKADAESYVDHTYAIVGDRDCVQFSFRENHHHDMSGTNFDDSKNLPAFKAIAESITFSK